MLILQVEILLMMFFISSSFSDSYTLVLNQQGCMKSDQKPTFYKTVIDDVILHEQLVLSWPFSKVGLDRETSLPVFGACSGILIRPSGRFVQRSLTDGVVSFWVLRAEATLTCPPTQTSSFFIVIDQWIEPNTWSVSTSGQRGMNYESDGPRPTVYSSIPSRSVRLDCSTSSPSSVIHKSIKGYIRRIRLSWNFTGAPSSSKRSVVESADLHVFIRLTSEMLFDGNFTNERKRVLCEFFSGFWCDSSIPPSRVASDAATLCVPARMRCDGLPDCNPTVSVDQPRNVSVDELNCDQIFANYSSDLPMTGLNAHYNATLLERWTSRLPWLVLTPIPFILICALVRICSQKRQLDLAEQAEYVKPDSDPSAPNARQSALSSQKFVIRSRRYVRRAGSRNPIVSLPSVAEVDEVEPSQIRALPGLDSDYGIGDHMLNPSTMEDLDSMIEPQPIWNRSLPSVCFALGHNQTKKKTKHSGRMRSLICWPPIADSDVSFSSSSASSISYPSSSKCSQCGLVAEPLRRSRSCSDMVSLQKQICSQPARAGFGSMRFTLSKNPHLLDREEGARGQYGSDIIQLETLTSPRSGEKEAEDPDLDTSEDASRGSQHSSSPRIRVLKVLASLSELPGCSDETTFSQVALNRDDMERDRVALSL